MAINISSLPFYLNAGSSTAYSPHVGDTEMPSPSGYFTYGQTQDTSGVASPVPHERVFATINYASGTSFTRDFTGLSAGQQVEVRLLFSSADAGATHEFTVSCNGTTLESALRPYVEAGNTSHKAFTKTHTVTADGSGNLSFTFAPSPNNPYICGFEFSAASGGTENVSGSQTLALTEGQTISVSGTENVSGSQTLALTEGQTISLTSGVRKVRGTINFPESPGATKYLREDDTWAVPAAAVSDGDKGDITVSSSGATWTIDNSAVTTAKINDSAVTTAKINDGAVTGAKIDAAAVSFAKIQNITEGAVLGRTEGSGTGSIEELTPDESITTAGGEIAVKISADDRNTLSVLGDGLFVGKVVHCAASYTLDLSVSHLTDPTVFTCPSGKTFIVTGFAVHSPNRDFSADNYEFILEHESGTEYGTIKLAALTATDAVFSLVIHNIGTKRLDSLESIVVDDTVQLSSGDEVTIDVLGYYL